MLKVIKEDIDLNSSEYELKTKINGNGPPLYYERIIEQADGTTILIDFWGHYKLLTLSKDKNSVIIHKYNYGTTAAFLHDLRDIDQFLRDNNFIKNNLKKVEQEKIRKSEEFVLYK